MKKINLEELDQATSEYILSPDLLNEILERLKNAIIANGNLIMSVNKEDVLVRKKQIKIKKLLEIIDEYKGKCNSNNHYKKIVTIYRGDPYLTLHICLQALTQRKKVALICEEFMIGVNEVLITIIEEIFRGFNITNLISYANDYTKKELSKLYEMFDNTIVIGNTMAYQLIKSRNNDVKFFPYYNIILYCEEPDFIKLQEAIYIYANENELEVEILETDSLGTAIQIINLDYLKNAAILLTKNNKSKELFKKSIKSKQIYINDNPFKEETGKIYNYLG